MTDSINKVFILINTIKSNIENKTYKDVNEYVERTRLFKVMDVQQSGNDNEKKRIVSQLYENVNKEVWFYYEYETNAIRHRCTQAMTTGATTSPYLRLLLPRDAQDDWMGVEQVFKQYDRPGSMPKYVAESNIEYLELTEQDRANLNSNEFILETWVKYIYAYFLALPFVTKDFHNFIVTLRPNVNATTESVAPKTMLQFVKDSILYDPTRIPNDASEIRALNDNALPEFMLFAFAYYFDLYQQLLKQSELYVGGECNTIEKIRELDDIHDRLNLALMDVFPIGRTIRYEIQCLYYSVHTHVITLWMPKRERKLYVDTLNNRSVSNEKRLIAFRKLNTYGDEAAYTTFLHTLYKSNWVLCMPIVEWFLSEWIWKFENFYVLDVPNHKETRNVYVNIMMKAFEIKEEIDVELGNTFFFIVREFKSVVNDSLSINKIIVALRNAELGNIQKKAYWDCLDVGFKLKDAATSESHVMRFKSLMRDFPVNLISEFISKLKENGAMNEETKSYVNIKLQEMNANSY